MVLTAAIAIISIGSAVWLSKDRSTTVAFAAVSNTANNTNTITPVAIYTTEKGDTLWELARRFNVPLTALMNANPGINSKPIQIGEKLHIPSAAGTAQFATPIAKSPQVHNVPFFSQFKDISSPQWQEVGCGITSLAMVINFYKPNAVSVNDLLQQGIDAGAYNQNNGWVFDGLIQLAGQYGLSGNFYNLSQLAAKTALNKFTNLLDTGPIILAVHNQFNPQSAIAHLIVIDGMENGIVYYNDPAAKIGKKKISITNLVRGWEKGIIVLRPRQDNTGQVSLKEQ